jgi:RHS repeat-associated protein
MGRVGYKFTCAPSNCGETAGNYYLQHTYDIAGDLTIIYNGYLTFDYAIGAAGRVTEVTDAYQNVLAQGAGGGSAPIAYAPTGAISGMLLGNGLSESSVYNYRLQPCRMNVNSAGTVLSTCSAAVPSGNVQDFTYGFTPGADNGNLTSFAAVGMQNFNRSYGYDHFNRLQTMSAPGDVCSGLSWNVDPWGNRTQQNNAGGTCFQPQLPVNPQNQLTGSPYQYDAAGNLTYDGNHHYTYDAENRIVQVDSGATAIYAYDASGDRVEKQMPGADSDYLYDGGQLATRWTNGEGNIDGSYVYLGGEPLMHYYSLGGTLTPAYVQTDHLGSIRIETASYQTVVQCNDYYPFGESIGCGKTQYMLKQFTGKERDSESGLDDFGARYYGSSLGRFMTPDWAARPTAVPYAAFGDPQSLNLYGYVRNDPVTRADADGHCDNGKAAWLNARGYVALAASVACGPTLTQTQQDRAQSMGTKNGYVYVSAITDSRLNYDSNGHLVSSTVTTATARFSTEEGEEGKFLGAELTTTTTSASGSIPTSSSSVQDIGYGGAAKIFGADSLAAAVDSALPQYQFVRAVGNDARAHPGKYAFYGVEAAAALTPIPEAYAGYEGAKAAIDVGIGALHLAWDLTH